MKHADGVRHCISRKNSDQAIDFSLAYHTGEDPKAVQSNRQMIQSIMDPRAHFVSPLQVHGDHIHVVRRQQSRGWDCLDRTLEADALVTNVRGVVLTILTADCVPVLIYDPRQKAIGAVHAGWQGTHKQIVRKTVEKMNALYGSKPSDLIVGIGPAIGGCCYEVGADVAEHFWDDPHVVHPVKHEKFLLDLKEANRQQLESAGVIASRIEISRECTVCASDRYFSHRAEPGCTGRFMGCISIS